jgi:hypothetical protein
MHYFGVGIAELSEVMDCATWARAKAEEADRAADFRLLTFESRPALLVSALLSLASIGI